MRSRKLTPFAFLLILSNFTFAQVSTQEYVRFMQSKLFDANSAEYKLEALGNGRGIGFFNRSKVAVTQFRLGCVKRKKNQVIIFNERSLETNKLSPMDGENIEGVFWGSNHGFFPLEECKKGKLAVIEVYLEDGDTWKLK